MMPNSSQNQRNRKGCIVLGAIVALVVAGCLLIALGAKPSNRVATKIQTVPANQR